MDIQSIPSHTAAIDGPQRQVNDLRALLHQVAGGEGSGMQSAFPAKGGSFGSFLSHALREAEHTARAQQKQ